MRQRSNFLNLRINAKIIRFSGGQSVEKDRFALRANNFLLKMASKVMLSSHRTKKLLLFIQQGGVRDTLTPPVFRVVLFVFCVKNAEKYISLKFFKKNVEICKKVCYTIKK